MKLRLSASAAVLGATVLLAGCNAAQVVPTPTAPQATTPVATTPPDGEATPPSNPSESRACQLVSAEEMAGIIGQPMTITDVEESSCTYTAESLFPIFVLRIGTGETIDAAKMITENGRDLTIGGLPAYYGEFMGGILYVQRGSDSLVVQAPLQADDPIPAQIQAIAELAVTRW
jgi:hypothetical protein